LKGTLPQKVCQSVDGPLNAPAAPRCDARARSTAHRTSGEGTSKQTQPKTNRRVGSAAAAIGLVAISSLFLHQKSDRAMAAEPVVKAPALGTGLGSAATETPTWPYTPASEAIGAVTRRFSLAAGGHEFEWSPEKYWSLGGAQPQFQEISVEVTQIAEAGESSLADRLSGYERFNVNQTITSGQFQSTTSQWPQLLTSTVVLSDGTDMVPFMVSQPVGFNVPGLIPEMTSVHPVYVDGLRAEIQGLWEKYHAQERSWDLPDLETPRVVPIGLGSEQMREAHPSLTRNRHRVRAGETLGEISRQYDVSIPELMQANQLTDGDLIKVNQLLTIPRGAMRSASSAHRAPRTQRPATSIGFARAESSTFNNALGTVEHNRYINRLLLEMKRRQQNQATSGDNSRVNNGALLPAGQLEQSQPLTAPSARRETTRENTKKPEAVAVAPMRRNTYDQLMPFERTVSPQLPPLRPPDRYLPEGTAPFNGYIWPAKGTLTSRYGWRWGRMHKGIDIAGPIGTPILSAGPGVVDFAGWNLGGYGNLVEIRHPDGSLTRYAHNNRILVNKGQQVKQGQQIAEMGSTGYSTGPHLHFEVHPSGSGADNPISYLPPRK